MMKYIYFSVCQEWQNGSLEVLERKEEMTEFPKKINTISDLTQYSNFNSLVIP